MEATTKNGTRLTFIVFAFFSLISCFRSDNIESSFSAEILGIIETKADSFRWRSPISFAFDFPWQWDSLYFVDADQSTLDIPRGAKEIVEKEEYADNYLYIFFTLKDSIVRVTKIDNSNHIIVFNPCVLQHIGYSRTSKFYVTKDCLHPKVYYSILPDDCDSTTIFMYNCP